VLIFDEATSSLDAPTAEGIARTVNQLRGSVTIVFIAHQLPKGLQVDEVVQFTPRARKEAGPQPPTQVSVVEEAGGKG
jgi:subfamily B ATP-binding cassette protein HlyB/CyaB